MTESLVVLFSYEIKLNISKSKTITKILSTVNWVKLSLS